MQATKEVNLHSRIVPCVNMWSVFFFFFFLRVLESLVECWCTHMPHRRGRPSGVDHTNGGERRMNSNSIVSHIHVNTGKLCNITCTLVAHMCDTMEFRVYYLTTSVDSQPSLIQLLLLTGRPYLRGMSLGVTMKTETETTCVQKEKRMDCMLKIW